MEFQNCKISINNSRIMAQNLTLNEANNIIPNPHLGNKNFINHSHNGPINSSLRINYLIEINNEPNYDIVNSLKTYQTNPSGANISFASMNFVGYLTNYNFNISPNDLISASAEYIIFSGLEGTLNNQLSTDYNLYNLTTGSGLAHYWTANVIGNNSTGEIIEMDYSFVPQWKPIYKIGSPSPYTVKYLSAEETITFLSEYDVRIKFSGQRITELSPTLTELRLKPISGLYNNTNLYLSYGISGAWMTQLSTNVTNNIVSTRTTAINHY